MALRNPNGSEKKKELIATRKGRTTSWARDIRGLGAVLCASYALINCRGEDTARGLSRDPSRVTCFSDRVTTRRRVPAISRASYPLELKRYSQYATRRYTHYTRFLQCFDLSRSSPRMSDARCTLRPPMRRMRPPFPSMPPLVLGYRV